MATTMFVKHKVDDYGNWKRGYDAFASTRKEKGVIAASVHRDTDDPNIIIVMHKFKDMTAAMAFVNSEELKSAMVDAGVNGPPEFWFGEDIEQTAY